MNLINLMECSLPAFVYRASFLSNMFESLNYIKSNNIAVNKIFTSYVSYIIKPMDLVTFRVWEKNYIYWTFFKRLKKKSFFIFFS